MPAHAKGIINNWSRRHTSARQQAQALKEEGDDDDEESEGVKKSTETDESESESESKDDDKEDMLNEDPESQIAYHTALSRGEID